jgi:hypothetical protein
MNIESFVHGISQIPKAFFGALAQGERTISKLLNAFLDEKRNKMIITIVQVFVMLKIFLFLFYIVKMLKI